MIDGLCHLLAFCPRREAYIIAFDEPERGLTLDAPCFVVLDAIVQFTPLSDDGEIMPVGNYRWGAGIIRMAPQMWEALPHLIAKKVTERERAELAEIAAARKKAEKNPALVRRNEDRMLHARNRARQGKLF